MTQPIYRFCAAALVWIATLSFASQAMGQAEYEPLSLQELEEIVGPIALYPDDLIGIVLPASSYPLQIVQAVRYLEDVKRDSSLKPNDEWDETVVALLNYPEILELLNDDLDRTWKLGDAVVHQESDVIDAIDAFRERAYKAGNLRSDERQVVKRNENGDLVIEQADEEVIYVPHYEPERVVVYQPAPVYHYYDRPYPVYYYPYHAGYHFSSNLFWGVSSYYGWRSHHGLHVNYYGYGSHPYYGHSYYRHFYLRHGNHRNDGNYRRDNHYADNGSNGRYRDRNYRGDRWQPGNRHGSRPVHTFANSDARARFRQTNGQNANTSTTRAGRKPINSNQRTQVATARTSDSRASRFQSGSRGNLENSTRSEAPRRFTTRKPVGNTQTRNNSMPRRIASATASSSPARKPQAVTNNRSTRFKTPSRTVNSTRSSPARKPQAVTSNRSNRFHTSSRRRSVATSGNNLRKPNTVSRTPTVSRRSAPSQGVRKPSVRNNRGSGSRQQSAPRRSGPPPAQSKPRAQARPSTSRKSGGGNSGKSRSGSKGSPKSGRGQSRARSR